MDCIFYENLNESDKILTLNNQQIRHIRALRIRSGDEIFVTNGKGLTARATLEIERHKKYSQFADSANNLIGDGLHYKYLLHPKELIRMMGELSFRLGLAMPLLSSGERRDFVVEKAVELGVTDFFPVRTEFGQIVKYDHRRLNAKAISALEQCQRSVSMRIHLITDLYLFFNNSFAPSWFDKIIVADINGSVIEKKMDYKSVLVVVGPEGGFSKKEIEFLKQQKKVSFVKIANRRLRSETAAVTALSLVTNLNNPK